MSRRNEKITALIRSLEGRDLDALYLAFFECFNRQLFFEAHEVLEDLWLAQRGQSNDLFYKGLIQLAGAFVHIQKKRRQPALALFKLAQANLGKYDGVHESLRLDEVQDLIRSWMKGLENEEPFGVLRESEWPRLSLAGSRR
jgi:predicted metal-dependent hydrolase